MSYRDDARIVEKEAWWTVGKFLPLFLIVVMLLAALGFGLRSAGLWGNAYVGRKVFEQTQSYVHGKNTYIARLRLQFENAKDEKQAESLRRLILEEAETIDEGNLTNSNQLFIARLRQR